MSHLNLYASAVSETQFGHFDRHLNAYAMVAHALTDRLQGDVLRTFLGIPHLSPRERECLTFTAVGLRPAQIAHRLNMTKHTVDFHLKSARKKLNALTLTHAVARAIELEEITPW